MEVCCPEIFHQLPGGKRLQRLDAIGMLYRIAAQHMRESIAKPLYPDSPVRVLEIYSLSEGRTPEIATFEASKKLTVKRTPRESRVENPRPLVRYCLRFAAFAAYRAVMA